MSIQMELDCPNCGKRGYYSVVKTDPSFLSLGKECTPFFERIAGRDMSYRKHTRKCHNCKCHFTTIEMFIGYLFALRAEIERLEAEVSIRNKELKTERNKVADKLEALRDVQFALAEKCQEHQSHVEGINQCVQELHNLVNE